jgi:hypothetical protein
MSDMAIFRLADFGAELDGPGRVISHFEETDGDPDCENVASGRDVVEKLGKSLVLQIRVTDRTTRGVHDLE